ncbi:hypothetical protein N5K37_29625 [Delftia tsuruhatensis]|uniref:hypothetical protein n=1 Tax=Delftia tsuruhatensis TaxID=180282 RepID=UPI00244C53FE|nr:hypothetical protein [Delftia tsuruhatensis]MDH2234080.1 hypothetical protein [Delftia tsuruhatensis]
MNTTTPATTPSQWGNIETLPEHKLLIVAQHTSYEGKKARAFIQQRDARSSAEGEKRTLRLAKTANEIAARSAASAEKSMKAARIAAWVSGGSLLLAGLIAIVS